MIIYTINSSGWKLDTTEIQGRKITSYVQYTSYEHFFLVLRILKTGKKTHLPNLMQEMDRVSPLVTAQFVWEFCCVFIIKAVAQSYHHHNKYHLHNKSSPITFRNFSCFKLELESPSQKHLTSKNLVHSSAEPSLKS